jgi:hypothetical protein
VPSDPNDLGEIDYEAAYAGYLERFTARFGDRRSGAFVKLGRHMIQKLDADSFPGRLDQYLRLHSACAKMVDTGATISDALVLDFAESSSWIAIEPPSFEAMLNGKLGDARAAAPQRIALLDNDITDPEIREAELTATLIDLPIGRILGED